jgi:hypothetical protein
MTPALAAKPAKVPRTVRGSAHAHKHHVRHHRCRTRACRRRVEGAWRKKHPRPAYRFPPFALCVANRESGEPGSYSFNTIRWGYVGEGYEGAYNWVNSTWLAEGGGRFARHANEASPRQQTEVFMAHENSRDWPLTVPACGG